MRRVLVAAAFAATLAGVGFASGATAGTSGAKATSQTFYPGPEATMVVPSDGRIHVVAIGGTGGTNIEADAPGGYGAVVTADLPVRKGTTLYVDVGGNGGTPDAGLSGSETSGGDAGTINGYGTGGGGGGASVVATCSAESSLCTDEYYTSAEPRLVVAGGGGGAGGDDGCAGGSGGGGNPSLLDCEEPLAGNLGGDGTGADGVSDHCRTCSGGGYGATPSSAGAGGESDTGQPGSGGSGPVGGDGFQGAQSNGGGGGGGGGYYGGGGGGWTFNWDVWGAGAGAGSSYAAPNRYHVAYGNDASASPSVTIDFVPKLRKV